MNRKLKLIIKYVAIGAVTGIVLLIVSVFFYVVAANEGINVLRLPLKFFFPWYQILFLEKVFHNKEYEALFYGITVFLQYPLYGFLIG